MNDYIRTLGVNGGVFAAVSLAQIEMVLKIVLLVVTIIWTGIKCWKLLNDDNNEG
tara:strand:+ start:3354 stop:3518 length:165 start_codon:yes stop_codon:yes gene_type:complete